MDAFLGFLMQALLIGAVLFVIKALDFIPPTVKTIINVLGLTIIGVLAIKWLIAFF